MTEEAAGPGKPRPSWQRPFVAGYPHDGQDPVRTACAAATSRLRPYLLTSGRTEPIDNTLEIEAQVATSELGAASQVSLAFEQRDIVALCRTTMSVAEIGAKLDLHIGVARILVADLAALGYLVVRRPSTQLSQDLDMIERVIRGLESIR